MICIHRGVIVANNMTPVFFHWSQNSKPKSTLCVGFVDSMFRTLLSVRQNRPCPWERRFVGSWFFLFFFRCFFIWFHPNMIPNDAKQNNPPRIWSQIWPPLVMAGEIPSFSRDRPVPSYAVRNGSHLFDLSMISPELKVRRPKCADLLWVHSEFLKHRHVSHGKLSLCWFVMGPILSYVSS